MAAKKKPAVKSAKSLKNTAKGTIHHMEITPAKNSHGGQAFISRIHRNRPADVQAKMDAGGPYTPSPEPEETLHDDGQDMVDHVHNTFGIKPEDDGDGDDDQGED
jgi:hypothetical protein